jgi:hypothetical protein
MGLAIWDRLDGSRTGEDLEEEFVGYYPDLPGEQIAADVRAFLDRLGEIGFLEDATADDAPEASEPSRKA